MNFLKKLIESILNLFRKKPTATPIPEQPNHVPQMPPGASGQAPSVSQPVSQPATLTPQPPMGGGQRSLKDVYNSRQELVDDLVAHSPYPYNVYLGGERLNVGAGPDDVYGVISDGRVARLGFTPEPAVTPGEIVKGDQPAVSGPAVSKPAPVVVTNEGWKNFKWPNPTEYWQKNYNYLFDNFGWAVALKYAFWAPMVKPNATEMHNQTRWAIGPVSGALVNVFETGGGSQKPALGLSEDWMPPVLAYLPDMHTVLIYEDADGKESFLRAFLPEEHDFGYPHA